MATDPGWHFLAGGVRQGPVSEAVLRGLVAGGVVPGDAMVQTPAGEWLSASAAPELLAPPPARQPARNPDEPEPPPRATPGVGTDPTPDMVVLQPADAAPSSPPRPRLWNPNAAANWSLVFTPAFGALLHAANWRTLGDPRRARANVIWASVTLAAVAGTVVTAPGVGITLPQVSVMFAWLGRSPRASPFVESSFYYDASKLCCVLLLFAWYFAEARPQVRRVKRLPGGRYKRRGWGLPLLAAVVGVFAVAFAASIAARSIDLAPAFVAAEVRADIQETWSRQTGAGTVVIRELSLERDGEGEYSGFVDATVGGQPTRRPVKVRCENERTVWELGPPGDE